MMMEQLEAIDRWLVVAINGCNTPFLDELFWLISGKLIWIPFYVLVLAAIYRKYNWKVMLAFFVSVVLSIVITDQLSTHAFKEVFLRYRPSHNLLLTDKLHFYQIKPGDFYKGGQYGFISSHAANFAAMAALIYAFFSTTYRFLRWLLPLIVLIVCLSRVYLGVHYVSDVLAGAIVGCLVGFSVHYLFHNYFRIFTKLES
jgi:undecaprenyl-diphosphatase